MSFRKLTCVKYMPTHRNKAQQKGGSSDFMHSFYANTAVGGPAAISQATLAGIDQSPMFNPLSATATIPGNSTGIVPSGLYLSSAAGQTGGSCGQRQHGGCGCSGGARRQHGGALDSLTTAELRTECNNNGISCRTQNGGYKTRSTMIRQLGGIGAGTYADADSGAGADAGGPWGNDVNAVQPGAEAPGMVPMDVEPDQGEEFDYNDFDFDSDYDLEGSQMTMDVDADADMDIDSDSDSDSDSDDEAGFVAKRLRKLNL